MNATLNEDAPRTPERPQEIVRRGMRRRKGPNGHELGLPRVDRSRDCSHSKRSRHLAIADHDAAVNNLNRTETRRGQAAVSDSHDGLPPAARFQQRLRYVVFLPRPYAIDQSAPKGRKGNQHLERYHFRLPLLIRARMLQHHKRDYPP